MVFPLFPVVGTDKTLWTAEEAVAVSAWRIVSMATLFEVRHLVSDCVLVMTRFLEGGEG